MTKYVFLSGPAYGHVNPTLALAQELVQRGEQVVYYLTEEFRTAAEGTGAIFQPYQSTMGKGQTPSELSGQPRHPSALLGAMARMRLKESQQVIPQVLERLRAEQADFIVYDPMCLWARIVSQILHIPAILLCPTYVEHEHFSLKPKQSTEMRSLLSDIFASIQADLDELCASYHTSSFDVRDLLSHTEALTIVFMPRAFQPGGETFDERFVFVGPSIAPRKEALAFPLDLLEDRQTLFISLGTAFNFRPAFFKLCLQAFDQQPWQVVMAHGKHVNEVALGEIPQNFLLASYVPQLEVLQRASVFVTHGGMNSVMESLYFGVPMVLVPQMFEQEKTAQRCVELGLGMTLDPHDLTAETLRAAVEQVQQNPSFRTNVLAMRQNVHAAGGYQRAADAICDFARAQK